MQNIFKRILSCGMALLMCLGITTVVHSTVTVNDYIVADAATDYYADITATKGTALSGQLHDLIVSTHKTYTSYKDVKNYSVKTDPGAASNTVMEFYTHIDIANSNFDNSGGWNREHVWAQSLSGDIWGTSNCGSDLHHIRPAEKDINNHRGNKLYGEVGTSGTKEYTSVSNVLGGYSNSSTFEPLDNVKGDVARIVMYVYTHYNTASNVGGTKNSNGSGTLRYTQIIKASNEDAAKKLLLEWNKLDPVDDIERYRNNAVYEIQGNRNPFIDNETYADAIWGNGTSTEIPVDPSVKVTSVTVNPPTLTLSRGASQKLTATVTPSNANGSVTWNSDNPIIASVSADGVVTAKSEGTAKIYATSTQDTTKKSFATVTVTNSGSDPSTPVVPIDKVTVTRDSFVAASGAYGHFDWSASGIKGNAFIYGGTKDKMQFNSTKQDSYYIASNSAPSNNSIVSVTAYGSGTNKNWTLYSSATPYGEEGATPAGTKHSTQSVTENGTTWTLSGEHAYFALAMEGQQGAGYLSKVEITFGASQGGDPVTPPPQVELKGITVAPSTVSLSVGQTKTLTVLPDPLNAKVDVNWSTSNSNVATVSNGVVTAKGEGSATITATDKTDTSIKSTATVTVGASNAKTVTVTLDSFTLTDEYGFKTWSQDGLGGIGYIFGGNEKYPASNIQLSQKKESCYIASNLSAGGIKSITIKNANTKYSADWTLLTADTPYGEVAGVPDTGTDCGKKTVQAAGEVTWQLEGSQKYFALCATPNADGYTLYLDSIVIVYEGEGQGGNVPDIDEAKLTAFHNAVAAIDTAEKDLEVFDAAIKAAEAVLETLTADEKAAAFDDIKILNEAKLEYELAASQGGEQVDQEKTDAFTAAVLEIMDLDESATIDERETKISAAETLLESLNIAEKLEVMEEIDILSAARIKLEQDKKAEENPVPPEPPVNEKLVAFHNAVEAIDNDGTIEERETQIVAAEAIYVTLTANEKAEALDDIAVLKAAKEKLEQDKNGGSVTPDPDIDQAKLQAFHAAVEAIDANGTLAERLAAINNATEIMDTLSDAEIKAAQADVNALAEAYKKYLEDLNGGSEEPEQPSQNVTTFKAAVNAIPSNGALEAKFNAIKTAIAAYQKLTETEKSTLSTEISALNKTIADYNQLVNSYNASSGTSNDIAVGGMHGLV